MKKTFGVIAGLALVLSVSAFGLRANADIKTSLMEKAVEEAENFLSGQEETGEEETLLIKDAEAEIAEEAKEAEIAEEAEDEASAEAEGSREETGSAAAEEAVDDETAEEISAAEEETIGVPEEETSEAPEEETAEEPIEENGSVMDGFSIMKRKPVFILYTNDVHCRFGSGLGYETLSAMKKLFSLGGAEVLLVDAGDSIQGGPAGTLSDGEFIIELMNAAGYDVAAIGNHEFDYGMEQLTALMEKAEFPYVCCNITKKSGEELAKPYEIVEKGGIRIAFIGITTPTVIVTSNTRHFKDAAGNVQYDFCQDETGEKLYERVQSAVDSARAEGADYVIALSHLGVEDICTPWMSTDVITHVSGIDAFLDGHSHTVIEREMVKDASGKRVLLTQTGTAFQHIGVMSIGIDGRISSMLLDDGGIGSVIDEINGQIEENTKTVVAKSSVDLLINDPVNKTARGESIRLVRRQETNLGDLCADAMKYAGQTDIALLNSGAVRADIPAGEITNGDVLTVHPFNTPIGTYEISGAVLLDALEFGARAVPEENAGFLQVSGITMDVDLTQESTVRIDSDLNFLEVAGKRRVGNVMINGEALEEDKIYTVTLSDFLAQGGDGYSMFKDLKPVQQALTIDNKAVLDYMTEKLKGKIGNEYGDPYGEGRISMIEE